MHISDLDLCVISLNRSFCCNKSSLSLAWYHFYIIKWAATWQNQQNEVCIRRRIRPAWASAQSDQSLHCALNRLLRAQCVFMQRVKTLIWLGGCPGWSESSLGTQVILLFCHVAAQMSLFWKRAEETDQWLIHLHTWALGDINYSDLDVKISAPLGESVKCFFEGPAGWTPGSHTVNESIKWVLFNTHQ